MATEVAKVCSSSSLRCHFHRRRPDVTHRCELRRCGWQPSTSVVWYWYWCLASMTWWVFFHSEASSSSLAFWCWYHWTWTQGHIVYEFDSSWTAFNSDTTNVLQNVVIRSVIFRSSILVPPGCTWTRLHGALLRICGCKRMNEINDTAYISNAFEKRLRVLV